MRYLIVNADDFGLTEGVNEGIIEAHEFGIVCSTTMLVNTEHFDSAVSLLKKHPELGVGVHLALTDGRPLLKGASTIVSKSGYFYKNVELSALVKKMDPLEIEREFSAQIDKLIDAGIKVTHLATRGHIHSIPEIHAVVLSLAAKYGIGMRRAGLPCPGVKTTEEFTDRFYNEAATELNFKMLIKKYERAHSLEIKCHPGHFDSELVSKSRYAKKREMELRVLTKYELQAHLEKLGVALVNYGDLSC